MNLPINFRNPNRNGSALLLTMIMCGVALAILAAAMVWSVSSTRLTYRSIQYARTEAAAEAATEKVVSKINQDFQYGGQSLVLNNMSLYQQTLVPTAADSAYWNNWQFDDGNGNIGQTYVAHGVSGAYVALDPPYAGLNGYITTYTIVSHAQDTASIQAVNTGVLQQLQLATIPIFQFAMYSSGDMEVSCGQPFVVTGPVHSNGNLYVEPDNSLTFASDVTAVTKVFEQTRNPLDTRGTPAGSEFYVETNAPSFPVAALTLPIGTTNTPEAIREIIEPPPAGEDPTSPLGRSRYYNLCDMVVVVSGAGIAVTSGSFNGFSTLVPTNEWSGFISLTNNFYDARERKTVQPIDINVGLLSSWTLTNFSLRPFLNGSNLSSVYVQDARVLPSTSLGAVRVFNGEQLPPDGLTVATECPLYIWGDYNQTNTANLGTTNTSGTLPASFAADAITILSDAWTDANSTNPVASRVAANTTVNAAFLTGAVETTQGHYGGGMENFPRFLENWGSSNTNTYNGSMIKMFPSLFATGVWNNNNNIYNPPARNWSFDHNFTDPTKLPPKTPSLQKAVRTQWFNAVAGQNVAVTTP